MRNVRLDNKKTEALACICITSQHTGSNAVTIRSSTAYSRTVDHERGDQLEVCLGSQNLEEQARSDALSRLTPPT